MIFTFTKPAEIGTLITSILWAVLLLEETASSKGAGTNTMEMKSRGVPVRISNFFFSLSICIFNPLMLAVEEESVGSVFIRCGTCEA